MNDNQNIKRIFCRQFLRNGLLKENLFMCLVEDTKVLGLAKETKVLALLEEIVVLGLPDQTKLLGQV